MPVPKSDPVDPALSESQPEQLKADHANRPLWIDSQGKLTFESFHPLAPRVQDFLVTVAEPMSRPALIHEYKLTTQSLYAAVSVGLTAEDIMRTLKLFLKNEMPSSVREFITRCGESYGKVKIVLRCNEYFVETKDASVLKILSEDPEIRACQVHGVEINTTNEEDDDDDQLFIHTLQIRDEKASTVARRCLELHYPALEEYDFRNDTANPDLRIDLRPTTQIRPYQEQSLNKMFGNGRAKSGIIVLPCGAGKSLVGVTAACTIKKGVVVLATNNISAMQWKNEFSKWSTIDPNGIALFSSANKSAFTGHTGVIITTYSMVTNPRERVFESAQMIDFLHSREWGLMLLDEAHVVPAQMFRSVIGSIKAHSKLGLTATLLREDDKIDDLNFLIGPKLYEANWRELSEQGHIAKVLCAEVWCPMSPEFYEQYLKQDNIRTRSLLCAMNPSKFQACQHLINYHEARGDKIIVFSDNLYALSTYARQLTKPFLHGGTSTSEREEIVSYFRHSPKCNTLFMSKIGDTSLDIPEATCLIQISSQYGSRRQEAQRLGRILRAKRRSEDGFTAFFYSLVSKDTMEMVFSSKRQAFLVDQGYAFKVITQLKGMDGMEGLKFNTAEDRHVLLRKVLAEGESKALNEEEESVSDYRSMRGRSVPHSDFFRSMQRQRR